MDSPVNLKLLKPKGHLSHYIQGIWSASVSSDASNIAQRWLHSDAGSGILFNLSGKIVLGNKTIASGGVLLPVSEQAELITLSPGSLLVGFRFHPGVGFAVLGEHYEQPTQISQAHNSLYGISALCDQLQSTQGDYARISVLYRWLSTTINFNDVAFPAPLRQAVIAVQDLVAPGMLGETIPLSQRQIERQFKRWIGMSAKKYQRILRVKHSLDQLKLSPETNLAGLALQTGFTDQAHMTREFKQIAKVTPGQYIRYISCLEPEAVVLGQGNL